MRLPISQAPCSVPSRNFILGYFFNCGIACPPDLAENSASIRQLMMLRTWRVQENSDKQDEITRMQAFLLSAANFTILHRNSHHVVTKHTEVRYLR